MSVPRQKALLSMNLQTLAGNETFFNDVHPLKAPCPILVTDSGIDTSANEVHPEKAPSPMLVTESGITTLSNELHS